MARQVWRDTGMRASFLSPEYPGDRAAQFEQLSATNKIFCNQ